MLLVIAVNVGMVVAALDTFPGKAGSDGFDLSNRYNQVIERVQQQAALGWTVQAETDGSRPVLLLTDQAGKPLRQAVIRATAERPLGATDSTALTFLETQPGRYVADVALAERGQWDLMLSARAMGHELTTTRRILVR